MKTLQSEKKRGGFTAALLLTFLFVCAVGEAGAALWVGMVDNADSKNYSETGNAWVSYKWAEAINGQYRYLSHKGHTVERKGTATWRLKLPFTGTYRVDIHYRPTENRTTDADFHVYDGRGVVHKYSVDQTYRGPLSSAGWLTLGRFHWGAGQTARVVLDGTDDIQSDEADAVRFVLLEGQVMQTTILQQLLLNDGGVGQAAGRIDITGRWRETGGFEKCLAIPVFTDLRTDASYGGGFYTLIKNGVLYDKNCQKRTITNWKYQFTNYPTPQAITSGEFRGMMGRVFEAAESIGVLQFSENRIVFFLRYGDNSTQYRTMEKQ